MWKKEIRNEDRFAPPGKKQKNKNTRTMMLHNSDIKAIRQLSFHQSKKWNPPKCVKVCRLSPRLLWLQHSAHPLPVGDFNLNGPGRKSPSLSFFSCFFLACAIPLLRAAAGGTCNWPLWSARYTKLSNASACLLDLPYSDSTARFEPTINSGNIGNQNF